MDLSLDLYSRHFPGSESGKPCVLLQSWKIQLLSPIHHQTDTMYPTGHRTARPDFLSVAERNVGKTNSGCLQHVQQSIRIETNFHANALP